MICDICYRRCHFFRAAKADDLSGRRPRLAGGQPARSAIGFGSLPIQIPVEIEVIFRMLE